MSQTRTRPAKRAATYEDLRTVPEHLVAEILFGELVTHRLGVPRHAATLSALGAVLGRAPLVRAGRSEPCIFLHRVEVHLGPHVVVPDIAAWQHKRLSPLPDAWIDTAPDWACEVLSPATEVHGRGAKREIYAAAGVRHLWLVDPAQEMLEVFELREGKWLLPDVFHDDAQVAAPPFAELTFALGLLWPFEALPRPQP